MYNLLIGGAAGQGVETAVAILERFFKQAGCGVFTMRDLMSRIRGGHNFARVRFGQTPPKGHSRRLDGIQANRAPLCPLGEESRFALLERSRQ